MGKTRARVPALRCVLCLFLAETCHMLLVPPFLVKSNGDTEVSPERQRFVNNSRAPPSENPFGIHRFSIFTGVRLIPCPFIPWFFTNF